MSACLCSCCFFWFQRRAIAFSFLFVVFFGVTKRAFVLFGGLFFGLCPCIRPWCLRFCFTQTRFGAHVRVLDFCFGFLRRALAYCFFFVGVVWSDKTCICFVWRLVFWFVSVHQAMVFAFLFYTD